MAEKLSPNKRVPPNLHVIGNAAIVYGNTPQGIRK